jgi:hypothetical protein
MDRFAVVTVHGDRETLYHVVDREAHEDEQPAIVSTYSTNAYSSQARSCAVYAAEVHNGRGYKGDPAYLNALARSSFDGRDCIDPPHSVAGCTGECNGGCINP